MVNLGSSRAGGPRQFASCTVPVGLKCALSVPVKKKNRSPRGSQTCQVGPPYNLSVRVRFALGSGHNLFRASYCKSTVGTERDEPGGAVVGSPSGRAQNRYRSYLFHRHMGRGDFCILAKNIENSANMTACHIGEFWRKSEESSANLWRILGEMVSYSGEFGAIIERLFSEFRAIFLFISKIRPKKR